MSKAIDNLTEAMNRAQATRPRVGGFPHLAEILRQAGVTPRAGQIDNQSFGILQPKHMLHDRRGQRQRQHRTLAIGLQRDPIQLRTSGQRRRAHRHSSHGR